MILLQVAGGLGNQMFQYALARKLAGKGDGIILADRYLLGVQLQPARKYRLHKFCVQTTVVPWHHVVRYNPLEFATRLVQRSLSKGLAKRVIYRMERHGWKSTCEYRFYKFQPDQPKPPLRIGMTVTERHFHFDPEVLTLTGDTLLMGYWQTEKYFSDIAPQLRADFQPRSPLEGEDARLAAQMRETLSVSLHVRRGDKAVAADFNGTTPEFCLRAMEWCRSRLKRPTFYVFSDDWEWTRRNLPESPDIVLVGHNSLGDDVEDWKWEENLTLMSRCKHHIIAPSSFSWWAAWLNPDPDKIVLSPPYQRWLNFRNCDTSDVIPESWIQLDDR